MSRRTPREGFDEWRVRNTLENGGGLGALRQDDTCGFLPVPFELPEGLGTVTGTVLQPRWVRSGPGASGCSLGSHPRCRGRPSFRLDRYESAQYRRYASQRRQLTVYCPHGGVLLLCEECPTPLEFLAGHCTSVKRPGYLQRAPLSAQDPWTGSIEAESAWAKNVRPGEGRTA